MFKKKTGTKKNTQLLPGVLFSVIKTAELTTHRRRANKQTSFSALHNYFSF
jgi:hypothetical protein